MFHSQNLYPGYTPISDDVLIFKNMEEYFLNKYSAEGVAILKSPPPQSTIRVNTLKISVPNALSILQGLFKDLEIYVHPIISDLICITSIGPIPRTPHPKCAYVDSKCGEAVLRGASIYCPGLLGTSEN